MNEELFNSFDSLTFDDVLIVPGYTEVLPNETDVKVQLTPNIQLNIPILSAAMDTVTEARLAIALAREGGLGIIHRNMPPDAQAAEVEKVKRSPETLDQTRFAEIEKPSARVPVEHFSSVTPKLFESIIAKYMSMGGDKTMSMPAAGQDSGPGGMNMAIAGSEGDPDPGSNPAGTDATATSEPSHPATDHDATREEN